MSLCIFIKFFSLFQNLKNQIMTTNVWVEQVSDFVKEIFVSLFLMLFRQQTSLRTAWWKVDTIAYEHLQTPKVLRAHCQPFGIFPCYILAWKPRQGVYSTTQLFVGGSFSETELYEIDSTPEYENGLWFLSCIVTPKEIIDRRTIVNNKLTIYIKKKI